MEIPLHKNIGSNTLDWEVLQFALEEKQCILILGPGVSTTAYLHPDTGREEEKSLSFLLSDYLIAELEKEGKVYQGEDKNLFDVATAYEKECGTTKLQMKAKHFYKNHQKPGSIYQLIQALPVYLIINTNPDNLLEKAYDEAGKQYQSRYFNYLQTHRSSEIEERADKNIPVIYNIFGSIEQIESVVLTREAQLEFVEQFILSSHNSERNSILKEFIGNKRYLLLGFNYEDWNLRILPKVLFSDDMQSDVPAIAPKGNSEVSIDTELFFKYLYNFQFVNMTTYDFINKMNSNDSDKKEETNTKAGLKVFILYHQNDIAYKDRLNLHLNPLKENQLIHTWDEGAILPGQETNVEIQKHLTESEIILLLISIDLLASDKYDEAFNFALEKHHQKEGLIFPILIKSCNYLAHQVAQLDTFLPRNKGGC